MLNFSITNDGVMGRECEYRLPAMASVTEAYWKFIAIAMDSSYEVLSLINDDDGGREEIFAQRWMVDDGEVNLVKVYKTEGGQLLLELYQHRLLPPVAELRTNDDQACWDRLDAIERLEDEEREARTGDKYL